METPDSLREAIIHFDSFENCKAFMLSLRWSDGIVKCPRCNSEKVFWIEKERVWKCYGKHDHAKFSLKTGTIFEDSPIALQKWLPATWLIINCKNGISSYELGKDLGVTQKSAWFMLQRIRLAMQSGTFTKLAGEVEVDESFIGGKARNMHADVKARKIGPNRGPTGKAIVAAVLERGGKIRATVVDKRKKKQLHALVHEHVEPKAALYSDALKSYDGLDSAFAHQVVDHAIEYVNGNVHTNGLENFWSLLKRALRGTYVSVEPYHLHRYLGEQVARFNDRKLTDAERFTVVMRQIVGKRLTWEELIGKVPNEQSEMRPPT